MTRRRPPNCPATILKVGKRPRKDGKDGKEKSKIAVIPVFPVLPVFHGAWGDRAHSRACSVTHAVPLVALDPERGVYRLIAQPGRRSAHWNPMTDTWLRPSSSTPLRCPLPTMLRLVKRTPRTPKTGLGFPWPQGSR